MIERIVPLMPVALAAAADMSLPDPSSASAVGWLVLTAAGAVTIVKLCLDTWKEHFREQPRPSETYVTIPAFNQALGALTKEVEKVGGKIDEFSSSNYDARRRMHKKLNGQQNALHYLAGTLARDGQGHEARHIRSLITEEEDHAGD